MGVPLSPVLMVRKMSPTAGPDLNWPLVRSAGRLGNPKSSFSPGAFSPSPLPVLPWHSQHILDVLDDGETIRQWQLIPGWHRCAAHPTGDRPQQVAIGRDWLLGQPELEHAQGKVSRALIEKESRGRPVAIPFGPVAADAPPLVDLLAVGDPFVRAR